MQQAWKFQNINKRGKKMNIRKVGLIIGVAALPFVNAGGKQVQRVAAKSATVDSVIVSTKVNPKSGRLVKSTYINLKRLGAKNIKVGSNAEGKPIIVSSPYGSVDRSRSAIQLTNDGKYDRVTLFNAKGKNDTTILLDSKGNYKKTFDAIDVFMGK